MYSIPVCVGGIDAAGAGDAKLRKALAPREEKREGRVSAETNVTQPLGEGVSIRPAPANRYENLTNRARQ